MLVSECLDLAADYIAVHGWTQNFGRDGAGAVCMLEACFSVADGLPSRQRPLALSFLQELAGENISVWNDSPGRTVSDVLLALRWAAQTARCRERW